MDSSKNETPVGETPIEQVGASTEIPVNQSATPGSSGDTPQSPEPYQPPSVLIPPGHKRKLIVLFGLVITIIVLLGIAGFFAGIAYGAIPVGSQAFRNSVSDMVQKLPFLPKSPEYVIRQMQASLKHMKQYSVQTSVSASNLKALTTPYTGSIQKEVDTIKVQVKGTTDVSDEKNPKVDVQVTSGEDLDVYLRLVNYNNYFKLNKIPAAVGALAANIGFSESIQKKFINQWLFYGDLAQAGEDRKQEEERRKKEAEENAERIKLWDKKIEEALRTKKISIDGTMTSDTVDGFGVYKVSTMLDTSDLKEVLRILDEIDREIYEKKYKTSYSGRPASAEKDEDFPVQNLNIVLWIDKSVYYPRKVSVKFNIVTELPDYSGQLSLYGSPQGSISSIDKASVKKHNIPITFDLALSNINKPVTITIPEGAKEFNAFMQSVMQAEMKNNPAGPIAERYKQSNNAKRRGDVSAILNAINQYIVDNRGNLPPGITSKVQRISKSEWDGCVLVPSYIPALPADPNINTGRDIQNCSASYMTGYTVVLEESNIIKVAAPFAEDGEVISVSR